MGLSDEERAAILWSACNEIYKKHKKVTGELSEACRRIWPAFIGNDSNSGHWLFGTSAGNPIVEPDAAWSAGVQSVLDRSWKEDYSKRFDGVTHEPFDPFHTVLSIEGLLRAHANHPKREWQTEEPDVYSLFAWTEQAVYALRRYDDDFLARHKELSDHLSVIQGICYDRFSSNEAYARAYLLNHILKKLYGEWGDPRKGKDPVREALHKVRAHAFLTRPMREGAPLSELRAWDKELRNPKKMVRLVLFLKIAGPGLTEPNFNALCNAIKVKPKQRKRLRKAWETHCLKPAEERKDIQDRVTIKDQIDAVIHGFLYGLEE